MLITTNAGRRKGYGRPWYPVPCAAACALLACFAAGAAAHSSLAAVAIDYPADGSIFPPEITPPIFLWRDPTPNATLWKIEVAFTDGFPSLHATSQGPRMKIGKIDPNCISKSNELPRLTPAQADSHTWTPGAATWNAMKSHSTNGTATITITGYASAAATGSPANPAGLGAVSRGLIAIRTSTDPVGAPIFYRDVPLMPTETEQGQIKPLAPQALPLVNWRLRSVGERDSRLLLSNLPVCANCHSFSADGKTMGMDLDGLQNNKGQFFLTRVQRETAVARDNIIQWRSLSGRLQGNIRAGFMSQVSPDGQFVATTINPSELDGPQGAVPRSNYYVTNYRDYRFLQVFFPTRGILAWYSRTTGVLQPLPGADDQRFVQMTAVWSPDGQYLVFARAAAQDPNPEGAPTALSANDPNERQVRFDLYRIPFHAGRGGQAEPLAGASDNGMSNTFPKVSPDGKWIVYVQCRNGQLIRPDSQLYIVPAGGGVARRMRCNTPLMNSWHSFSPNSRWLVFSSKSRSPYTQMYLTHIDQDGNDSPAILIDNATAANRAVNLPEFVNVAAGGFQKLGGPALDYYKLFNSALFLQKKGRLAESAEQWQRAVEANPADPIARDNYGMVLMLAGRREQAGEQVGKSRELRLQAAVQAAPGKPEPYHQLGLLFQQQGRVEDALAQFSTAVGMDPGNAALHTEVGTALVALGKPDEAIHEFERSLSLNRQYGPALYELGAIYEQRGDSDQAISYWRQALALNPGVAQVHLRLAHALSVRGAHAEALEHWRRGLQDRPNDATALREAAWILATSANASLRNGPQALAFAVRALLLNKPGGASSKQPVVGQARGTAGGKQSVELLDTLAAAYAECGRFADAALTARRALGLGTSTHPEDLKHRLSLYERQTPFHETRSAAP